ncbi:hypothetical protein Tco_0242121 [Tanacetum coccineum]
MLAWKRRSAAAAFLSRAYSLCDLSWLFTFTYPSVVLLLRAASLTFCVFTSASRVLLVSCSSPLLVLTSASLHTLPFSRLCRSFRGAVFCLFFCLRAIVLDEQRRALLHSCLALRCCVFYSFSSSYSSVVAFFVSTRFTLRCVCCLTARYYHFSLPYCVFCTLASAGVLALGVLLAASLVCLVLFDLFPFIFLTFRLFANMRFVREHFPLSVRTVLFFGVTPVLWVRLANFSLFFLTLSILLSFLNSLSLSTFRTTLGLRFFLCPLLATSRSACLVRAEQRRRVLFRFLSHCRSFSVDPRPCVCFSTFFCCGSFTGPSSSFFSFFPLFLRLFTSLILFLLLSYCAHFPFTNYTLLSVLAIRLRSFLPCCFSGF